MPSRALQQWATVRTPRLDEIESAHAAVGGTGPGRRIATRQINNAYVMLLSSEFQGFCRDLHTESADALLRQTVPDPYPRSILRAVVVSGRRLDTGNPNPGNIGSDFGRFGFIFWDAVYRIDQRNRARKRHLDALNLWRNAIAHQDFSASECGGRDAVQLVQVQQWRAVCTGLAASFETAMQGRIQVLTGTSPW